MIEASGGDWTIKDTPLAYDYPDYRRLVEARTGEGSPRSAPVDPVALRAALAARPRRGWSPARGRRPRTRRAGHRRRRRRRPGR